MTVTQVSMDPVAGPAPFDPAARWSLHPSVAVRPEPFGALLYHFGTRRLSFIKDRSLLAAVQALENAPSAQDACTAAGVEPVRHEQFLAAMARLAGTDMLVRVPS